jgi:TetR/AcrR family transcriptional regulator
MPQPQDTTGSVRDRLLHAAMELFATRGYAATSIRELVGAAGVTKPVLYYHFQSKEGLYLALVEALRVAMESTLAVSAAAPGTSRQRLERLFGAMFALFEEHQASVRFLNAAYWGPAQGAPAVDFQAMHLQFVSTIERVVAEGVAAGEFRRVRARDAAAALLAVVSYSMDLSLAHPELGPGRAGVLRMLRLVFAGIAPQQPARRRTSP